MKKVLLGLALFFCAYWIADRIGTYLFSEKIFAKTLSGESGGSFNYLVQRKKNIDLLVMGSSRAKHQIDPELLTNTHAVSGYNAGINGVGTIIYNSILLDILINNGIIPKVVVLQTDPYQFSDNGSKIENELAPLYPYIEQSSLFEGYLSYRERIKLTLHSYRFNGKFLNIFYNYFKRNSISDNKGFVALKQIMDSTVVPKKPAGVTPKFIISATKIKALNDIVKLCKRQQIKLIVVIPPIYNNISRNSEGNEYLFNAIRKSGVTNLLDLSDVRSIPGLRHASVWKDRDHLNETGAIIFSKAINDRL